MSTDLLTPFALAEMLAVSEQTIRKWHKSGAIPAAVSEGVVLRFEFEAVRAALIKRSAQKAKFKTVPTY